MKQVWKFPVQLSGAFTLTMSVDAQVLDVQLQRGSPQLWALVDPDGPKEERLFAVFGTGHIIPPGVTYVGTFQLFDGDLVIHLFEATK